LAIGPPSVELILSLRVMFAGFLFDVYPPSALLWTMLSDAAEEFELERRPQRAGHDEQPG
jgi:hypothetical protein